MVFKEQLNYVNSLDSRVKRSLHWYTKSHYKNLNTNLRLGKELSKTQKENLKNIDFAFLETPRLKDALYLYRGVENSEYLSTESFVSCTLSKDMAVNFMNGKKCCLMEILVSKGSRILPLFTVAQNPAEKEILLDRGGILLCNNVRYDGDLQVMECIYSYGVPVEKISTTISEVKYENGIE